METGAGSDAGAGAGGEPGAGATGQRPLVLVLNGPNINMLGLREPEKYGTSTLADVQRLCETTAAGLGLDVDFRQSNHEGVLIDWIQEARGRCAAIVINPAAYTHTSVAILDALMAAEVPVVEVHITNVHRREEFRHRSFVSLAAEAVIAGAGVQGYELALRRAATLAGVG